jgi:hypothetical protein
MLVKFSATLQDLTSALRSGLDLTDDEQLFLENHLMELQIAYTKWKARRRKKAAGGEFLSKPLTPLPPRSADRIGAGAVVPTTRI